MSGAVVVELLREAFYALPNGSIKERTAYIMRRRAELERGIDNKPATIRQSLKLVEPGFTQASEADLDAALLRLTGVKPYAEVADDPRVQRSQESE